jgi:hypothetical protein
MRIKYIHASDPMTEKIFDTKKVFNNLSNPHVFDTQEELDAFELRNLATDKELGIIIDYKIIEEE